MKYSQLKATLAITKASLQSMFKSPSTVIFSIAFPLIFILVFGFIGDKKMSYIHISFTPQSDTSNELYTMLSKNENIFIKHLDTAEQRAALYKGNIDAVLNLSIPNDSNKIVVTNIQFSAASAQNASLLKSIISQFNYYQTMKKNPLVKPFAQINEQWVAARPYKTIDFVLPGQLGFSLLSAAVFGTAFVFYNLRQTLVLKRFFATPINRFNIILGETLSRLVFQLVAATIIILIGRFVFGFTLIHGFSTFIQMLLLCFLGLLVFMSFGFVVSGLAKSEGAIPPFANLITLPQFLLAGTLFSIYVFPSWLQPISRALPLTYLNDALRKVAFEGLSLWDVKMQILILIAWGVAGYVIAVKTFRWE